MWRRLIGTASLGVALWVAIAVGDESDSKGAESKPRRISYSELGTEVEVIGCTGEALGKLLQIEGSLFQKKPDESVPKRYDWTTVFVADRVNGRRLAKPVRIDLRNARSRTRFELTTHERMRLTGYEDGGFAEEPTEVLEWRRKRGEPERAGTLRHFDINFYVLESAPVKNGIELRQQRDLPEQQ